MAAYAIGAPLATPLACLGLFGTGALIMRSAGCTINDMADRDFDKAVDRTKDRPIARGDITRQEAFWFLGLQLSGGLAVLTQLNWYSIFLGAASLPVVAAYPFMKRFTYWPQSVLGLAFNWGAMLGWSAVAGSVNWAVALPLYAGGVCWTLVYDTIYAHQDKSDDVKVGVRSTALLFGTHTRSVLTAFSVSAVSLWALAGYANAHGLPYFLGVGLAGVVLARILRAVDFDSRASCWDAFRRCGLAGVAVWAGAGVDYVLSVGLGVPTALGLW
ncbi:4-hydroxybenzoate polyprenyl transferase [Trametopsis cervina]|nr:4-hydroxybenzoate polyprenyl transferase [Trametopsis cervina]